MQIIFIFILKFEFEIIMLFLRAGAFSSVGLEHYLDRVGVTGSNPVMPTVGESGLFSGLFSH
jgi:hypothetical protein